MSSSIRAADTGGKIIIDGNLRHRHAGAMGFQKWKQRYVAFKVTNSGRLEFVIYNKPPAIPDNEFKHVAIDEFGGLETNLKLDSEKYTFAVITNSATECFSVDSPHELTEWTKVIQEYLGKELVLNITIPHKQNILRAGRAQLRIRNLGFTITTCDNPPRVQGSWQVIHIRKYGGSEFFKFETGTRCPTGECLYTIQTEDNKRVKSLFSELSQHKPIFTDDRVGRRMTLERSLGGGLSTRTPGSRVSMPQPPPPNDPPHRPLYENRDVISSLVLDGVVGRMGRRHSADADEDIQNLGRYGGGRALQQNGTPGMPIPIDDHRQYANWNAPGRTSPVKNAPGRTSPTKKVHNQLPIDYYSVTPPPVIQKSMATNTTPGSSPEAEKYSLREEFHYGKIGADEEYSMVNPVRTPQIIGDHIMFKEDQKRTDVPVAGHGAEVGQGEMYQNLTFLHGNPPNGPTGLDSPSWLRHSEVPAFQPSPATTETDGAAPNYTNVQMALEAMQSKKAESNKNRKRSEPYIPGRREPKSLELSQAGVSMKGSHSSHDLSTDTGHGRPGAPDYYNMCATDLPANNSRVSRHGMSPTLSLTSLHQPSNGVDSTDGGELSTHSNTLATRHLSDSERRSRSPMHTYDTLLPVSESKEGSNQLYDRLSPLPSDHKSSSSSPEPVQSPTRLNNHTNRYARKVHVIQHHHKYEYIDVELEHSGESASSDGVFSPTNTMEHPLTWMAPGETDTPPPEERSLQGSLQGAKRLSLRETKSKPRKKQLPLQTMQENSVEDTPPQRPRAPGLTRVASDNASKPVPAVRKSRSKERELRQSQVSAHRSSGSSDDASSFELIPDDSASLHKHSSTMSSGNGQPKIANIQVELVKEPAKEGTPPPIPPRSGNSDGDLQTNHRLSDARQAETPPIPPRPHHRVSLPPVQIDFTKTPTPPRPRVLGVPDTSSKKYVALNFGESVDLDDNAYTAVKMDQPIMIRTPSVEQQPSDERVSYSAVNFPIMNALHSTIRERIIERANN